MCGCREKQARQAYGPCEVCGMVRGDWTPKHVTYCGTCKAWICDACWGNLRDRAIAAVKRWLQGGLAHADHQR